MMMQKNAINAGSCGQREEADAGKGREFLIPAGKKWKELQELQLYVLQRRSRPKR